MTSSVRAATDGDMDALLRVMQSEPAAAQWSRAQLEPYLHPQLQAATQKVCLCATVAEEIAGFIAGTVIGGEAELENIAVIARFRRNRIGRGLIEQFARRCAELGASEVHLEVRSSNTVAIAAYEKRGFLRQGARRGYYASPPDDAILMHMPL